MIGFWFTVSTSTLAFLSMAALALVNLFWGKRSELNRAFSVGILSLGIWEFGVLGMMILQSTDWALICAKLLNIGAAFIPAAFLHSSALLAEHRTGIKFSRYVYLLSIGFCILVVGNLMVKSVVEVRYGYFATPGPLYPLFAVFLLVSLFSGLYLLLSATKRVKGIRRVQIKYVIFASSVAGAGGLTSLLPLFGMTSFYPIWNITNLCYGAITTYAILRHRLMDIEVIIRKSLVYSVTLALITAVLFVTVYLVGVHVTEGLAGYSMLVSVLVMVALGFLFQPLRLAIERLVDRIFGKSRYEYLRVLNEIGGAIATDKEIRKSLPAICARIAKTLEARHAEVWFVGEREKPD